MIKSGGIGEVAVMKYFLQNGFEVYTSISDNSEFDMLVIKDSEVYKVEVKSTGYIKNDKYIVQLKSVRPNRTGNKIVHFDNTKVDFLAVYIVPEDRVEIFYAPDITQKAAMTVNKV